jgi:hypothetical protein
MNHGIIRVVVVITNDRLRALLDVEGGTRNYTIVAYKVGWSQVWVDLLLKGLDSDFVKVYLLTIDGGRAEWI